MLSHEGDGWMMTGYEVRQQQGFPPDLEKEVLDLLERVDQEFIPPLSSRSSTSQMNLEARGSQDQLRFYYEELKSQSNLMLTSEKGLLGFASYKERFSHPDLTELGEFAYLTTIATHPSRRGQGLGRALYEELFKTLRARGIQKLVTRTWSTNDSHLPLLKRLGFREVLRLEGHRGPSIDSVYFLASL